MVDINMCPWVLGGKRRYPLNHLSCLWFYFLMTIPPISPEKICNLQPSSKDEETQDQEARHPCTPLLFHTPKVYATNPGERAVLLLFNVALCIPGKKTYRASCCLLKNQVQTKLQDWMVQDSTREAMSSTLKESHFHIQSILTVPETVKNWRSKGFFLFSVCRPVTQNAQGNDSESTYNGKNSLTARKISMTKRVSGSNLPKRDTHKYRA